MFKRTILIDSYALEEIADELGYAYDDYYDAVQELDADIEDGVCIKEYKINQIKDYEKYYSEMAIKILARFFEKHNSKEFVIVAEF